MLNQRILTLCEAKLMKEDTISKDKLGSLFQNLLDRAFADNLPAEWREARMRELLAGIEQLTKALAQQKGWIDMMSAP